MGIEFAVCWVLTINLTPSPGWGPVSASVPGMLLANVVPLHSVGESISVATTMGVCTLTHTGQAEPGPRRPDGLPLYYRIDFLLILSDSLLQDRFRIDSVRFFTTGSIPD